MSALINPIQKDFECADGTKKTFILSKFDAVSGREIVSQYPVSGMPKLGDYNVNEEMMLKLMNFVAVQVEGTEHRLGNRDMINNHVPDWEVLAKIEMAMMEMNCSFFASGKASDFLTKSKAKLPQLISSILTALSEQSSQTEKPPSQS